MEHNESIIKNNGKESLWEGVELDFRKILNERSGKLNTSNTSGKSFTIIVAQNKIRINLTDEEDSYFEAKFKKNKEGKSSIEFDIQTGETESGKKIPGLYSQKLTDGVIKFFGKENIDRIRFNWHELSPEYIDFHHHHQQIMPQETEPEALKRATFETWLGQIAKRNGFNEVSVDMFKRKRDGKLSYPTVTGYFYKTPISSLKG